MLGGTLPRETGICPTSAFFERLWLDDAPVDKIDASQM